MDSPILFALRAAAKDDMPLSLKMFTENHVQWAIESGLRPLLFSLTKDKPDTAASPFRLPLLSADLTTRLMSQERLNAMCEIIDLCNRDGIKITLLKGISICEQYYPEPHLRLMRDIDFLVNKCDYKSIESSLHDCGYRAQSALPRDFYTDHHHGVPLHHEKTQTWVEIHTGLFPQNLTLGQDHVFQNKIVDSQYRPSTFMGRDVNRLSNELQIVYIAAHGALEFRRVGGIVPLLDLIFLMKKSSSEIDWELILSWLPDSLAARHLVVYLTWLEKRNLVSVDRSALNKLTSGLVRIGALNLAIAHKLIDTYLIDGKEYGNVLTSHNLGIAWDSLMSRNSGYATPFLLPWKVIFPPGNPLRFSLKFQIRRILSALGISR